MWPPTTPFPRSRHSYTIPQSALIQSIYTTHRQHGKNSHIHGSDEQFNFESCRPLKFHSRWCVSWVVGQWVESGTLMFNIECTVQFVVTLTIIVDIWCTCRRKWIETKREMTDRPMVSLRPFVNQTPTHLSNNRSNRSIESYYVLITWMHATAFIRSSMSFVFCVLI